MPRRNIVQIRLSDTEREHAAGEASRAGQRLAEWGRNAIKSVLFERVVEQLEMVRERLTLERPSAYVVMDGEGIITWSEAKVNFLRGKQVLVTMNDTRQLLEATAEWLIGEAGKQA